MSLTRKRATAQRNPAELFIGWKGGRLQGFFEYYDKEAEDPKTGKKGMRVPIDLSKIPFIVLDKDLFSITGYNDITKETFQSNEVRDINDILVVKSWKDKKGKVVMKGSYADLKEAIKNNRDLKYTRCVYVMLKNGKFAHIQLNGKTLFEFGSSIESSNYITERWVRHSGTEEAVRGSVEYKFAKFEFGDQITEEEFTQAAAIDEKLQAYLDEYMKNSAKGDASTPDNTHGESQAFDPRQWRKMTTPQGEALCDLSLKELEDLAQSIAEEGAEGPLFEAVSQAMADWGRAIQGWKDKQDSNKRPLTDYSYQELKEATEKVPTSHGAYIFLAAALEEKKPEQTTHSLAEEQEEEWDEEDSIPF